MLLRCYCHRPEDSFPRADTFENTQSRCRRREDFLSFFFLSVALDIGHLVRGRRRGRKEKIGVGGQQTQILSSSFVML